VWLSLVMVAQELHPVFQEHAPHTLVAAVAAV
jgi:hypothetical protein